MSDLKSRYQEVQDRIHRACDASGRDPESVTLIAVSKTHPVEAVKAAYDLGLRHFGENRLQEAALKMEALPPDIVWHFIGHLQSNKAKRIAQLFDVVQTLCQSRQVAEIAKSERRIKGLVEINIANEAQKSGLPPGDLDLFLPEVLNCNCVHFLGLMTIGPATSNPEQMRPYFQALCKMNKKIGGKWLSMGMSGDLEVAIMEGSTHIRVGTALFGRR